MGEEGSGPVERSAADRIGDPDGLALLTSMVSIAPTNLEDPVHERYEKPNYARGADEVVRWARKFGAATRRFDPVTDLPPNPAYRGISRPSVIVDLEGGPAPRLLILAHYDVVPVPAEQLAHWKSPPHSLTLRADGRLYGRGSNDDLGSGLVSSLLALKRLAESGDAPRPVRLLVCCDEETGGLGGIEAMKEHDHALPKGDPERFLEGEVALIPDGSPHATAASSGLIFLDGTFAAPATPAESVTLGLRLIGLQERARAWRSVYPSPDWPDHGAPDPVITGRATVTRFDVDRVEAPSPSMTLVSAHAENEATNQIARAVTLGFTGPEAEWGPFVARLRAVLPAPFTLDSPARATAVAARPGLRTVQVVGVSAHAGYPHRGRNPVPAAIGLIRSALAERLIDPNARGVTSFSVDIRLTPEMTMEPTRSDILRDLGAWAARDLPGAKFDAPVLRARGGYALSPKHPAALTLERILREEVGGAGIFGEYGGTDASSLSGWKTPSGAELPALVFGSMDRQSHIHEAEESVDPRMIAQISRAIERFARAT